MSDGRLGNISRGRRSEGKQGKVVMGRSFHLAFERYDNYAYILSTPALSSTLCSINKQLSVFIVVTKPYRRVSHSLALAIGFGSSHAFESLRLSPVSRYHNPTAHTSSLSQSFPSLGSARSGAADRTSLDNDLVRDRSLQRRLTRGDYHSPI